MLNDIFHWQRLLRAAMMLGCLLLWNAPVMQGQGPQIFYYVGAPMAGPAPAPPCPPRNAVGIVTATLIVSSELTAAEISADGLTYQGQFDGDFSIQNGHITGMTIAGFSPVTQSSAFTQYVADPGYPLAGGDEITFNLDGGSCGYTSYGQVGTWTSVPAFQTPIPKTLGAAVPPSSPANRADPAINMPTPSDLGACAAFCGNPINVATGNKFQTETDFVGGTNTQLSFTRYYNSQDGTTGGLGVGWHSTYHRGLANAGTGVVVTRADGRQDLFYLSNGAWIADTDVTSVLAAVPAGGTQTGWALTLADDSIENYTLNGQLTSIVARGGLTTTLIYNTSNQLTTVTGPFGQTLTFTYDGSGRLQQMTTPDGETFEYAYDGNSNLISVTNPDATVRQYAYANPSFPDALTSIIDEDGNQFATWAYDSSGRAISSQHAGGADLTTVAYNSNGSSTVTNALGQQMTYTFATLQGVPKVVEIDRLATGTTVVASRKFTYDSNGYLSSQTDWNGNLTTYVNDVHGQPTTMVEAAGTAQARTTTTTYHPTFHLPLSIVTPGITSTFTYDGNGELLTKTLTDTTTTTAPYTTSGMARTWIYTWSNFLLDTARAPRTDVPQVTSFSYDASGALTSTTNALGQITKVTSHTGGGLPLTVVDPNGVTTTLTYDARQRLLTSTLATTAGVLTTTLTYDAAGNLIKTTLPDGSATANSYDSAHRLIQSTDLFNHAYSYTLDALGDRTQTQILDNVGNVKQTHTTTFDALGRMLHDVGGMGQKTIYSYDSNGNALTITDPLGHVTKQTFDALNRLTSATDAAGGTTQTTYDAHDRPLTVTDANGGTTSFVYDGFGDVIQRTSPDTGTTVNTYDLARNLTQSVNAAGATTNSTYDALNRPLTTAYPADKSENVAYTYDQTGHGFGIGRLTSVTDAAGSLSRKYDERGNVLSETRVHGTATLKTSTTYDAASRVLSLTYPSGWTISYTRDIMGRANGVIARSPAGALQYVASCISYEPLGPVNGICYHNGVVESRSYDLDYRLINITDTGKSVLQNLGYYYDADNNVSKFKDVLTAANTQTLGYDVLDRLTSAAGNYGSLAYTYSPIGNRLTQTSGGALTSYSYAPNSNQLAGIASGGSTQTLTTTAAGNISGFSTPFGPITGLTYNQANRLATVSAGASQLTQYTYNAFGQRIVKQGSATGTTVYQYDSVTGHLLEENDGAGNARVDYVYLNDQPVATIQPSNGAVYYLFDDRLGTPQLATDIGQNVQWTASYQPFGYTSTGVGLIVQNLRLPGQEFDAETGLYHNGFRDYVPGLGRYLESDPIGLAGGLNTYSYASGNPVKFVDRTGNLPSPVLVARVTLALIAMQQFEQFVFYSTPPNLPTNPEPLPSVNLCTPTNPFGRQPSISPNGTFLSGLGPKMGEEPEKPEDLDLLPDLQPTERPEQETTPLIVP